MEMQTDTQALRWIASRSGNQTARAISYIPSNSESLLAKSVKNGMRNPDRRVTNLDSHSRLFYYLVRESKYVVKQTSYITKQNKSGEFSVLDVTELKGMSQQINGLKKQPSRAAFVLADLKC